MAKGSRVIDPRLFDAFEDCLIWLGEGRPLEACLRSHPRWAPELRPALEVLELLPRASKTPPPAHAQLRSRARLLAVAEQVHPRPPDPSHLSTAA